MKRAEPLQGYPGPIGYALWHLTEARFGTRHYIKDLPPDVLDLKPEGHRHSVATLAYHIAVFEVDWVYTDILGNDYDMERRIPGCPPRVAHLLPYPLLLEDHSYTPVSGETAESHIRRLDDIRAEVLEVFKDMTVDEFRRPRDTEGGPVTPEWVLMHLARHESEHRGQIWEARVAAEKQLTT